MSQKNKMIKTSLMFCLIVTFSCKNTIKIDEITKKSYSSDINNCQLDVSFKTKKDTVFFFYTYAIDNGNFLNSADDIENEFAGYFLKRNIENNQVSFKIKNFRYSIDAQKEINNEIKLIFISSDEILWETDFRNEKNKFVPYLPDKVKLYPR